MQVCLLWVMSRYPGTNQGCLLHPLKVNMLSVGD